MRVVDHRWPWLALALLLFTGGLIGQLASSKAQDGNVMGAARTASVMAAIVRYCPAFFVIDGPKATKMGAAGYDLTQRFSPPGQGRDILKKEVARRTREVEATGAQYWCQNQREVHRNLGTELFLN